MFLPLGKSGLEKVLLGVGQARIIESLVLIWFSDFLGYISFYLS
jgi:hypothetical protein